MLHTTITWSVCNGRQMGACQNHATLSRLKRKLSFKQYYLLWQWFSSWKTSWAHFHGKEHCITPEPGTGRGTKEGSNSSAVTRLQDVLLLEPKPFGFSTTIFSIWFLAGIRKKKLSSSEALLEKLHIPSLLCQLAKHPETWHWACGYLFPSDIEVDIWCVSWQKLKPSEVLRKSNNNQEGFPATRGVSISVFGGVLVVAGTPPFQEGRYPRLQLCPGRSSSIPLLPQVQLGVFSGQGQKIPSQAQQSSKSSSSSSSGCPNMCLNSSWDSPDILGGNGNAWQPLPCSKSKRFRFYSPI